MKQPVVIIGTREMGGVFARGFLRIGHPVYPVTHDSGDLHDLDQELNNPAVVLVAVGEADLPAVMASLPETWRERIVLLQNALLPRDFTGLTEPTVISVWFEKKPCKDAADDLLFELGVKNLYILTTNIAGLRVGETVATLWAGHATLARAVASDVVDIQDTMTGREFDRERLLRAMQHAFGSVPAHRCTGRSGPRRLARALKHADRHYAIARELRDG